MNSFSSVVKSARELTGLGDMPAEPSSPSTVCARLSWSSLILDQCRTSCNVISSRWNCQDS